LHAEKILPKVPLTYFLKVKQKNGITELLKNLLSGNKAMKKGKNFPIGKMARTDE
jgi:hypothetical protein